MEKGFPKMEPKMTSAMNKAVHIFLLLYLIVSCNSHTERSNEWKIALRTAKSGEVVRGSKQELITAIRNGADIKIGWGHKGKNHSIEHLSEPIWLAVLDEKEVLAKLHPQYSSSLDWDSLQGNHADPKVLHQEWRVVINTNGSFDAIWYDRKADSLIRPVPQNHSMTWFVRFNNALDNHKLFDEN